MYTVIKVRWRALGPLLGKIRVTATPALWYHMTVDVISQEVTDWLAGREHVQCGDAGQRDDDSYLGWQGMVAQDFILLLRMLCDLKHVYFWKFSCSIFGLWMTTGTLNHGKWNHRHGATIAQIKASYKGGQPRLPYVRPLCQTFQPLIPVSALGGECKFGAVSGESRDAKSCFYPHAGHLIGSLCLAQLKEEKRVVNIWTSAFLLVWMVGGSEHDGSRGWFCHSCQGVLGDLAPSLTTSSCGKNTAGTRQNELRDLAYCWTVTILTFSLVNSS